MLALIVVRHGMMVVMAGKAAGSNGLAVRVAGRGAL